MRKSATILTAIAAFALGGIASAFTWLPPSPTGTAAAIVHPAWREVAWPFPMDQWGKGKAYQCNVADCGAELTVYLRAKIGFCNCTVGVSDDAELDRIGDADLFGGALYAQAPGQPVKVAWMKGRSRPFAIRGAGQGEATILSVGFNDRCDALVATAVLPRGRLSAAEPAVLEFLNGKTVAQWAEATLGL
jgi:hypothetical protein